MTVSRDRVLTIAVVQYVMLRQHDHVILFILSRNWCRKDAFLV